MVLPLTPVLYQRRPSDIVKSSRPELVRPNAKSNPPPAPPKAILSRCRALLPIPALRRFGVDSESFIRNVSAYLSGNEAELFRNNFIVVERDPLVVAAVAALVHVRDKVTWGILPAGCIPELWATYGAQIAAAVSGKYDRLPAYREALSAAERPMNYESFPRIAARAAALGFSEKWEESNG